MPITIGATNNPKISPNFTQILFKGVNILELSIPKIRKTKDINDSIKFILSPLVIGHRPKPRNTIKNSKSN